MANAKDTSLHTKTTAQLQAELNELLLWFESENVDLDEAVGKYERGKKVLAELAKRLKLAENTIKKVSA